MNKITMPNEQQEFLKSLETDQQQTDPFATEAPPEASEEHNEEEQESDEERTNRRERRLQAKLTAERESSIALAARLEALTEAQRARTESEPAEYMKSIERIYGTGSPEATEATELLKTAMMGVENRATERALELFREEQERAESAVANEEKALDTMVEEIEDEVGADMDAQTKKGFFQLLEKLSPKDRDGNIVAYADHHAVWEELQARRQPKDTRAKDLASRSMARSGASPQTSVADDATERYLREIGAI